ncbi:OLC1v1008917C1 [Oldenlandia corymbosa var. corymbosa]|uniref:OLC1v1008917C1 n=1 Tax=Oldenlandia corymbosa var. corymbosa TaxID=529605 RepID=A0AAV1DMT4_OLDCO|nr:OLC1v1008917C1 [Oldenlandia corymbosa var. corymbosa]
MPPRQKLIMVGKVPIETMDDLREIRTNFKVRGQKMMVPGRRDRAHQLPPGKMTVYRCYLELGLNLPLLPFVAALMWAYEMPLAQWLQNVIPFILGFLHICQLVGVKADVFLFPCFFKMVQSERNYTGWFSFQHNPMTGSHSLVAVEKRGEKWREYFFFVDAGTIVVPQFKSNPLSNATTTSADNIAETAIVPKVKAPRKRKSDRQTVATPSQSHVGSGKKNKSGSGASQMPPRPDTVLLDVVAESVVPHTASSTGAEGGIDVRSLATQVPPQDMAMVGFNPPRDPRLGPMASPAQGGDAMFQCISGLARWALCMEEATAEATSLRARVAKMNTNFEEQHRIWVATVASLEAKVAQLKGELEVANKECLGLLRYAERDQLVAKVWRDARAYIHDIDVDALPMMKTIREICSYLDSAQNILDMGSDSTGAFDMPLGIATPLLSPSNPSGNASSEGGNSSSSPGSHRGKDFQDDAPEIPDPNEDKAEDIDFEDATHLEGALLNLGGGDAPLISDVVFVQSTPPVGEVGTVGVSIPSGVPRAGKGSDAATTTGDGMLMLKICWKRVYATVAVRWRRDSQILARYRVFAQHLQASLRTLADRVVEVGGTVDPNMLRFPAFDNIDHPPPFLGTLENAIIQDPIPKVPPCDV